MQLSSWLLLASAFGVRELSAQSADSFVSLPIPVFESHSAPTNAETLRSQQVGRFPSTYELLQPSLDSSLKSYNMVPAGNLSGNYTFAASDVLAVLTERWITAFMTMYPNVTLSIPPPYAGSLGALELIKGNLQGVFVSRELKPSDISSFKNAFGYDPFSVPISGGSYRQFGALDTMVFVVHKDNPIHTLSFTQLDSILSTTRARGGKAITKWGELGVQGNLSSQPIQVYGLEPWNGIEEFVRQRVLNFNGTRGEWRNGNSSDPNRDPYVHWDKTIFNSTRHAYEDRAALSYTGLAYIDRPVKILSTYENPNGMPTTPTYENCVLGKWPLSRLVYFNTNRDPKKAQDPVLKELTKFILSKEGQQIALDHQVFLPFRADRQSQSLSLLG